MNSYGAECRGDGLCLAAAVTFSLRGNKGPRSKAELSPELAGEMRLVGESGQHCDIGKRQAVAQESLCASKAELFQVRVWRQASMFSERPNEMARAQPDPAG